MSELWVSMFVIWAIVEFIGFLRKKEFAKRMKSGAIWSTIFVSLATVGQMTNKQNGILQLVITLAFYGAFAWFVCFVRLRIAMFWQRRKAKINQT